MTLSATVASGAGTVNEGAVTFTVLDPQGHAISNALQAQVHDGLASTIFTLPAGLTPGHYTVQVSYSDSQGDFQDGGDVSGALTVPSPSIPDNLYNLFQNYLRLFQQQEQFHDFLSRFEDMNHHLLQNLFAQLEHFNDILLRFESTLIHELTSHLGAPQGR